MKKRRLLDLALLGLLLLISLLLFALSGAEQGGEGSWVVVSVGGEEVGRYPLNKDAVYELNGGSNTLVIEDGSARISEADCPDGLCIRQGRISRSSQTIICLPNRLVVSIEGADEGPELIS